MIVRCSSASWNSSSVAGITSPLCTAPARDQFVSMSGCAVSPLLSNVWRMDFLVGSRTFRSVRDVVGPGGELHAVRDEGVAAERSRGRALCGVTVIAFRGTSWRGNLFDVDTRPCVHCKTVVASHS
jgi:hypothetical protein